MDIKIPGRDDSPIVQPASERTVDYTVPFGTFGGVAARGFSLTAGDFSDATSAIANQLNAAGSQSFSPIKVASLETIPATGGSIIGGGGAYNLQTAALDTTDDKTVNYQAANQAVQRIIDAVGTDRKGRPKSNIIVVSDHGFAPFHTAVNINNFLNSRGFDNTKVRAITSAPAVNIYINLAGREPNGTVSREEYVTLQQQIVQALTEFVDTNPKYTLDSESVPVFDKIYTRPVPNDPNEESFGLDTSEFIGQDSGDVFAIMKLGYNFDGTQNPVVQRLGDATSTSPIFSVPNFYGAHGYDPTLPEMSAIFYAAGPDIARGTISQVRNIDIAPTILQILGVKPAQTVEGRAIKLR